MRFVRRVGFVFLVLPFLVSCSKTIGWGVLLWYAEDPPLPSGTVVPVYVRSNIEQMWIVGVPKQFRLDGKENAEIPLSHLELFKGKRAAQKRAAEFAEYMHTYAEVMQDGLPVRDQPENNARRVYRLRRGEVIKVLGKNEGVEAISTTGSPLSGEWMRILTENGAMGYCFSYRLKLFDHEAGPLAQEKREIDTSQDADLDILLSRAWYPESYGAMVSSGKINIETLSRQWGFDCGTDSGTARIFLPNADLNFPYSRIRKASNRVWDFEGSSLRVHLRSVSNILVEYEDDGEQKSTVFVTLPESLASIINRENDRRDTRFQAVYVNGPSFHSVNYGTITFMSDRRFTWSGAANLPRGILSDAALGSGGVQMWPYLDEELEGRYDGALTLAFDTVSGGRDEATFLYSLETQGLKLEYVPPANISRSAVTQSDPAVQTIYFSTGAQD